MIHSAVPTARPRHQVTETPDVAHALDVAAQTWPDESRSRLLLRLVDAGRRALEQRSEAAARDRLAAIEATSGKFTGAYGPDYLAKLRRDWPE